MLNSRIDCGGEMLLVVRRIVEAALNLSPQFGIKRPRRPVCYLLVVHPRSILALAFTSNPTALSGARSHRNSHPPGGRRGLQSKLRHKLLRTRPDSSWVY